MHIHPHSLFVVSVFGRANMQHTKACTKIVGGHRFQHNYDYCTCNLSYRFSSLILSISMKLASTSENHQPYYNWLRKVCYYSNRDTTIKKYVVLLVSQISSSKRNSIGGVFSDYDGIYAVGINPYPPRGVWGHAPPENFGNLDSLRVILRHSDSHYHFL